MAWKASTDPLKAAEAIAWFRARVPLTPEAFDALSERARRKAFKVAGATRLSMCAEVLRSLDKAVATGMSFPEWQKQIGPKLIKDWSGTVKNPSWRLETIFRTSVQSAYAAGRWRQLREPAIAKARPFWLFDAVLDERTTLVCRVAKGTCLPNDHVWWATHTPPLHFCCRSGIRALRASAAEARGVTRNPTAAPAQKTFGRSPDEAEWEPDPAKYPPELRAAVDKVNAEAKRRPKMAKARAFRTAFEAAFPKGSPYANHVSHYTEEQLQGMRCFLNEAGTAGVAVHDHGDGRVEATALFNRGGPGHGVAILAHVIDRAGVNYVECYGPRLPELYEKVGFRTVERYPFDPNQAAADWDYASYGSPDYHIMRRGKP